MSRRLRRALLAGAAAALIGGAAMAQTARHDYSIPAQPAGEALNAYARQSGVRILFPYDAVAGKRTRAVTGNMTEQEALDRLLADAGLVVVSRENGVVTLGVAGFRSAGDAEKATTVGELVVTGTRIPGATPASPVRIVGREEIDRSGYGTTGDVIRSIPQAFSGNINPGVFATGNALGVNLSAASSADLRGLGPSATLTLLNGHRMAYNGYLNTVDISVIPLPAVERVDVLLDGASALYGTDAVAGVVNFILRKDFEGAETTVRFGATSDGGASEHQVSQLVGHIWPTGNLLLNFEYYFQDELFADQRKFSQTLLDPTTIFPQMERKTAFVAANQQVTPWLSAFIEALYTVRDVKTITTEDFFGFLQIPAEAHTTQYGVTGGFQARLPWDWTGELAATVSQNGERREDFPSPSPPYSPGTVEYVNEMQGVELNAAGRILDLPAGELSAAVGAGFRREQIDGEFSFTLPESGSRDVKYVYAELNVPLLRSDFGRLELSGSGRYESYSDFGNVFNPKVGLVYFVGDQLKLRGTLGESFRAPGLVEVHGTRSVFLYPAQVLEIPGATPDQTAFFVSGANRDLQPERSRSWTIGVDYKPDFLRGLSLSGTYYDIHYLDRITRPFNTLIGVFDSPQLQPFIAKDPSPTLQAEVIAGATRFQNFSGGPYDPTNVRAIYFADYRNAASQSIRGVDLRATYSWESSAGVFDVFADASWLDIRQKDTPTSTERQISGFIFNPAEYKARGGVNWRRGAFGASAVVNYIDGSIDNTGTYVFGATETNRPVDSWTTVDAQLAYDTGDRTDALRGIRISLSMINVFNSEPPHIAANSTVVGFNGLGYDSANASPLGRFTSITVRKRW